MTAFRMAASEVGVAVSSAGSLLAAARWLLAALMLLVAVDGHAHGFAPLLLKIQDDGGGVIRASLKSSVAAPRDILPLFPETCEQNGRAKTEVLDSVRWVHWSLNCSRNRSGRFEVGVPNLGQYTVVVRYSSPDGQPDVTMLSAGHPRHSMNTGVAASWPVQLWQGVESGFHHLLIGMDHLLFIVGLCLWLRTGRALLMAVTAFTVGHSVTLVLVSIGALVLPIAWAELAIAASIVALALKLVGDRARQSPPNPWEVRWLPLGFGLVHGMGFASALQNAGLQGDSLFLTVLGFNVGIEAAQLLCVGLVLSARFFIKRFLDAGWPVSQAIAAYGIGGVAVFWCLERIQVIAA